MARKTMTEYQAYSDYIIDAEIVDSEKLPVDETKRDKLKRYARLTFNVWIIVFTLVTVASSIYNITQGYANPISQGITVGLFVSGPIFWVAVYLYVAKFIASFWYTFLSRRED